MHGSYVWDPMDRAREAGYSDPRRVDVNAEGVVWTGGGLATFRCHEEEHPDGSETLMAQMSLRAEDAVEDDEERMDRLEDLLRSYVAGVRELYECEVPASSS